LIEDIKAFYQRGKRGWADRDCWSLDWYLSGVMVEAINHLRKTAHGFPSSLSVSDQGNGALVWDQILQIIVDGLEAHTDSLALDWPEGAGPGENLEAFNLWEDEQQRKQKVAFILLGEYWGALWD